VIDYVVSQTIDVLALTETRLVTDTDQLTINELVPGGCEFNLIPRNCGRRGRGIGIRYRSGLTVTVSQRQRRYIYRDCTINIAKVINI